MTRVDEPQAEREREPSPEPPQREPWPNETPKWDPNPNIIRPIEPFPPLAPPRPNPPEPKERLVAQGPNNFSGFFSRSAGKSGEQTGNGGNIVFLQTREKSDKSFLSAMK
jgi:hypothetical protein